MIKILRIDPINKRILLDDVHEGPINGPAICRLISNYRSDVQHFATKKLEFGRHDVLYQEFDTFGQEHVFAFRFRSMPNDIFCGTCLILPWASDQFEPPSTSAIEYEREAQYLGEIKNPAYDQDWGQRTIELRSIPDLMLANRNRETISLQFRGWSKTEIAKHFHVSESTISNYIKAGRREALSLVTEQNRSPRDIAHLFGLPEWAMSEEINGAIRIEISAIERKRTISNADWARVDYLRRLMGEWPEKFTLQQRRDLTMQGVPILEWHQYTD